MKPGTYSGAVHWYTACSTHVQLISIIWSMHMSPSIHLLNRVRSEFLEMPGLRLRVDQAQRLWNLDRASCELLLSSLVETKFLRRYSDEAYGLPSQC